MQRRPMTSEASITPTLKHLKKHSGYQLSCRVCKRKATGFHYGVVTCGACKSFFARQNGNSSFKCLEGGNCCIKLNNRTFCAKCRLQKCYDTGMSLTAFKRGRYSSERVTECILESNRNKTTLIHELSTMQGPRKEQILRDSESCSEDYQFLQMLLIAKITSMQDLKSSEVAMHNTRGLDQRNNFRMQITFSLMTQVKRFISFLKNIPEFLQMTISDQVAVVKENHFEYIVMESYLGYNTETDLINVSPDECFHKDEMSLVWGEEFMADMFTLAKSLQHLELSVPEIVLTEMICLFSTDRCEIEERSKIEALKWRVVNTLLGYLKRTSYCPMARFAKIIDCMITMRTLSEQYKNISQRLIFQ